MSSCVVLSFWLVDFLDGDIFERLKSVFKKTANWITVADVPLKDVQIGIFTTKTKSPTNFTLKIVLDPIQFDLRSFHTAINKLTASPMKLVPGKLANVLDAMINQLERQTEAILAASNHSPTIDVIKEIYVFSSEVQSGPSLTKTLWKATDKNINVKFRALVRLQGPELTNSETIESAEAMICEFEKDVSEMENVSSNVVPAEDIEMVYMMKSWFRTILLHPDMEFVLTLPSPGDNSSQVQIACSATSFNYDVNLSMQKGLVCPCHQKLITPMETHLTSCPLNGAVLKKEDCVFDSCSIQIGPNQMLLKMNSFSSSHKELLDSSDCMPQLQILHRMDRERASLHRLPGSSFLIKCSLIEDSQHHNSELFFAFCQKALEQNECFVGLSSVDFSLNVFSRIPLYYYILLPAQDGKYFIGRKLASEEQIFSDCFPSLQQQTPSIEVLEKVSGILSKIPKQQNSGFLPRTLGIHDFVEKLVSESLPMKHINKAKTKAHLNKRQRL